MSIPRDRFALTQDIKGEARRLGFDLVGVTTPNPPPHLEAYRAWLAAGRHGEMRYLATIRARECRADPRRLLPECRSILVVGANYLPAAEASAPSTRVAAYARGQDYHDILPERLERLVAALKRIAGEPFTYRIYTDTGPILERELAQRAGLGWIGKNTCLIHPQRGSYFLLAEVLLGLDLVPDPPFAADHCGTCVRCLEACPTRCILPDRTLDASRCVSYLTIEVKETLPLDLRPAVGDWLFGCDICQEVCPWNRRFAKPSEDPAFQPRPLLQSPDALEMLQLEAGDLPRALRDSPLLRPRRRGLLRNAAVVAGNQADPEAVPILRQVLGQDPEALVRAHAAWALGRIGGPRAMAALRAARSRETDRAVLEEIRSALAEKTGGRPPGKSG